MLSIIEINHVSLWVKDVPISINFYKNILGLSQLASRPNFDFQGAWFALGNRQQLHILEGRTEDVSHSHSRRNHFAVQVESLQAVAVFLQSKDIIFIGPKARPDGIMQVFIQDPDGYWIEFTEILL